MTQLGRKRGHSRFPFWNSVFISIVFAFPYILNFFLGWSTASELSPEYSTFPWLRWDSYHYLSIATAGYKAEICGEALCGNTGWFPLYPFLVKLLYKGSLGVIPITTSAIIVSFCSFVVLCWNISCLTSNRWTPPMVAAFLLMMPGGIYLVSAFPISLLLCFVILAYRSYEKGNTGASALYGLFSGFTYPSAIFFALGFWPLRFSQKLRGAPRSALVSKLVASVSIPLGSFIATKAIDLSSGYGSAYALTQARYGHNLTLGFEVARSSVRYFWKNPIFAQTALVLVLLTVSAFMVLVRDNSVKSSRLFSLFLPGIVLYLLALMAGDTISIYRQEALLSPLFVFCGSLLSKRHLIILFLPVAMVSLLMFQQFFKGILV